MRSLFTEKMALAVVGATEIATDVIFSAIKKIVDMIKQVFEFKVEVR